MKYLFGDSTPFPLTENFLETVCAAREAAVAIFQADALRREELHAIHAAEERAIHELEHLEVFDRRVAKTYPGGGDPLRVQTAKAANDMVGTLRASILSWRDGKVAKALATGASAKSLPAIGKFFERHQLPNTAWSLAWKATLDGKPSAVAQVHARAPLGFYASFEVAIPVSHSWAKPMRVRDHLQGLSIRLLKKRFLRKPAIEPEKLDRYVITELIDLPGESSITLRQSVRRPSPGLRFVLSTEAGQPTRVARIDATGARTTEPEPMHPEDAGTLRRLFAHVSGSMRALIAHRSKIRMAYLGDAPVSELEQPADMARLIVESVAPYVREIAKRSSGRAELALKRTLGDGRREELFVAHREVLSGVESLEPEQRAHFNAFGLAQFAVPRVHAEGPKLVPPNAARSFGDARLPPPRLPGGQRTRATLPSDAAQTQERPVVRLASA
jgi:hypothetical protein